MLVIKTTEEFSQTPLEPSSEPSLEPKKTKGEIIINVDDLKSYNSYLFERGIEIDLGTQHIDELDDDDIAKKMLTNKEPFSLSIEEMWFKFLGGETGGGGPTVEDVVDYTGTKIGEMVDNVFRFVAGGPEHLNKMMENAIKRPDWVNSIQDGITKDIGRVFEPLNRLILELGNTFENIEAFTAVIGGQILSLLQGGLDLFGEIFKQFIESFLDVFKRFISFITNNETQQLWIQDNKSSFSGLKNMNLILFTDLGNGSIYDIAIRYMFYGIIVILFGIFLEILSISKIWAG